MLMTKYTFFVMKDSNGHFHSVVSRIRDSAQKYFFQASGCVEGITAFFESMTDELCESYFPKPGKNGKSSVDNWLFLGNNPGRAVAEELARANLIPLQIVLTHDILKGQ